MFINKNGAFLTIEQFKKVQSSFELKNGVKIQMKNMGMFGWQKQPDYIKHWRKAGDNYVCIPKGLTGFWNFKDEYGEVTKVDIPEIKNDFKGNELDLRQDKVLSKLLEKNIGLLNASTGTGKSIMSAKIIKNKAVRTLVVVSGITLAKQMQSDLESIFGVKYPMVDGSSGLLKRELIVDKGLEASIEVVENLIASDIRPVANKKKRKYRYFLNEKKYSKIKDSNIFIVNIDTLVNMPKEFFDSFDLCILDEVDTYLSADRRRETIWFKVNCKYIYGLTGTTKINHTPDKIFDIYFGPRVELILKNFQPDIFRVLTNFEYTLDNIKEYHKLKEALYEDEDRNNFIVKIVEDTIGDNKGIIFSEYINHAKILKEKLEDKGIKCFLLIGEIKDEEREEVKKQLKEYKGTCVLIGSVKIVGRGFNVPELSVGYLTTCEKFKSNIEQYVGRVIRKYEGKEKATWYDFTDPGNGILLNQSRERARTYQREFPKSSINFYKDFN